MSVVVALVTAVGAGISVLGFVAFFGAAVEWVRLDHAHLPGNEAVAVIPRSVLLTNGANFLAPAVLVALGFVGLLYLAESIGGWAWRRRFPTGKLRHELEKAQHRADVFDEIAQRAEGRADAERKRSEDKAAAGGGWTRAWAEARIVRAAADRAGIEADEARVRLGEKRDWDPRLTDLWRRVLRRSLTLAVYAIAAVYAAHVVSGLETGRMFGLIAVVLAAIVVYLLLARKTPKWYWRAIPAGVAIILFAVLVASGPSSDRLIVLMAAVGAATVISLAVLAETESFVWLALTAFFAVGVVDGLITYYRTVDTPKVEPAALLSSYRRPLYGFYVAETSDRIYLGTRNHGEVRMVSIPRDEVSELSIGPLLSQGHAKVRAVDLALGLCRDARAPTVATGTGTATAMHRPDCSARVVSNLKDKRTRLNRRLKFEASYKGTFERGGTVKFRVLIKHGQPVAVLGPPLSGHGWRFKNVRIHCPGQGNAVISNHANFAMSVHNKGHFHAGRSIKGRPTTIRGRFLNLNRVRGTLRIQGTVAPYTRCDDVVKWKARRRT
jgi:hypothetical protein